MRRAPWLGSVGLLALVSACGGGKDGGPGPPPSQAGDLVVTYFQGGPSAGALLLTISGGVVQGVTASSGQTLQVTFATVAGTTRVIVTGALTTGDILKVRVPDVTLSAGYTVHVDQVADNLTFSLIDPTVHTLTIHR